jgi:acetylornithine/succinyldiaminopimelate/putrescine aminotransferase
VLVTGKGLSGGIYPITATLMSRELHALFDDEPFIHISTFGGAEPACYAALAVLDLIEEPGFLERVRRQSALFRERLGSGLPFRLRQRGLMMAFASPIPRGGQVAAKMLYDAGVFATWANNDKSVLQFLPPLILDDPQADELCSLVRSAFGA